MSRILLALRAFFRILFNRQTADQVGRVLDGLPTPAPAAVAPAGGPSVPKAAPKAAERAPRRNDAITLLAALQREARFVDFIQEPIAAYSDAQIGAAVRDIHQNCGKLIERIFALQPIESGAEGAEIEVPSGVDAARIRLVGNVTGQPPFSGKLVHHGWQATCCELPEWTGSDRSHLVVMPAEVELK